MYLAEMRALYDVVHETAKSQETIPNCTSMLFLIYRTTSQRNHAKVVFDFFPQ